MTDETNSSSQANILIVDDKPANLRLLSQMLGEQGFNVRAVTSGDRALTAVNARLPDLILLDIRMPGMDGYQVCRRLKESESTRGIPVIFISALGETEDKIKAFTVGGVDYILKPFQIEEVLARVRTHLAIQRLQTDLRKANRELHERLDELQERNEELDAFAHMVAHDLKSPLGSMLGYSEAVRKYHHELPAQELENHLSTITSSGRKMANIIDELLLLASIRQLNEIEQSQLDMREIFDQALSRLSYLLKQHEARITLPDEWPAATGYAAWVEEIWANYLSNAIKYGGQPPIITVGGALQDNGWVRFWVQDNGMGLTQDQQAQLFTPFTRLHQTRARGHGLGLSIVARIADKLGGKVGLESNPGAGSTFYFLLPAASI